MKHLYFNKAQPSVQTHKEVPTLVLEFNEEIVVGKWEPLCKQFHQQGQLLEKALRETLPGGTYDALLGCMLKRKSSELIVTGDTYDIKS